MLTDHLNLAQFPGHKLVSLQYEGTLKMESAMYSSV